MTDRRHTNPRTGEVVDDPAIRPFGDFLRDQSQGRTHDELSEALWDLAARVRETGKKGSLTLVVNVEPMKGDTTVLVVSDEIKLKLPEFQRGGSVFYSDEQGNLSRSNPDQPELSGLREVPTTDNPIREAK
jgi:hypothetical protein